MSSVWCLMSNIFPLNDAFIFVYTWRVAESWILMAWRVHIAYKVALLKFSVKNLAHYLILEKDQATFWPTADQYELNCFVNANDPI